MVSGGTNTSLLSTRGKSYQVSGSKYASADPEMMAIQDRIAQRVYRSFVIHVCYPLPLITDSRRPASSSYWSHRMGLEYLSGVIVTHVIQNNTGTLGIFDGRSDVRPGCCGASIYNM
jgi:hypothetical protein